VVVKVPDRRVRVQVHIRQAALHTRIGLVFLFLFSFRPERGFSLLRLSLGLSVFACLAGRRAGELPKWSYGSSEVLVSCSMFMRRRPVNELASTETFRSMDSPEASSASSQLRIQFCAIQSPI
jgi:hypothetical protein